MQVSEMTHLIESQDFCTLFASVSGAHLYGFESPDSDVDLRGVFVLPPAAVLGLFPPNETVTRTFAHQGQEIDLVAHDILKFCRLLTRKNGYVLEQLYSPWVVVGGPLLEELREIARGCLARTVYHHYRGFLGNELKVAAKPLATVKDLLYGYRVALTGIHLLRTGEVQAHLPTLLAIHPQPGVVELIEAKRSGQEKSPFQGSDKERHLNALRELETKLHLAHEESPLPEAPGRLQDLSDFIVRVRLLQASS